jgi:hypothetical protein
MYFEFKYNMENITNHDDLHVKLVIRQTSLSPKSQLNSIIRLIYLSHVHQLRIFKQEHDLNFFQ